MGGDYRMTIAAVLSTPSFWIGCALRGLLLATFVPVAASDLYVPFFEATVGQSLFDPWLVWANLGGQADAFPYGFAMWLVFLPGFALQAILPIEGLALYFATLFVWEFVLLTILVRLVDEKPQSVLDLFWLSPITLMATYVYGYNDIIAVGFLLAAILGLQARRWVMAGVVLAFAISAKLSMLVALPIVALYFLNKPPVRRHIAKFSLGFIVSFGLLTIPFLASDVALGFVSQNSEMGTLAAYALRFGEARILLLPLVFTLFLYWIWRARRLSFNMFVSFLGVTFLGLALLTPGSAGWFVWSLPFLVLHQAQSGVVAMRLGYLYAVLFTLSALAYKPALLRSGGEFDLGFFVPIDFFSMAFVLSGLVTLLVTLGVIIGLRMWRESISQNAFFRVSQRPFMLAIAGDSGAGKDTLAEAVIDVFGGHSATNLSGDDYHRYDRQKPMWQVMTHLNPAANDLEAFTSDIENLRAGKTVSKRHYDHWTGKLSRPEKLASRDFIIASGLHAFFSAKQSALFDLKVFLAIDEDLRRGYKIHRDTVLRGKSLKSTLEALQTRRADFDKFVAPQEGQADIVFALQPEQDLPESGSLEGVKLKLKAKFASGNNEELLARLLTGLLMCEVGTTRDRANGKVEMTISGDISSADVAMLVDHVCSNLAEFFDDAPQWKSGMTGVMQVITLMVIASQMAARGSYENSI
jgi:uridine kinase